jgi:hypothetical protein
MINIAAGKEYILQRRQAKTVISHNKFSRFCSYNNIQKMTKTIRYSYETRVLYDTFCDTAVAKYVHRSVAAP